MDNKISSEIRKVAQCVYLACDAEVATDISGKCKAIADAYDLGFTESAANANYLYANFYASKPDSVGFELCDSVAGIQSQIDNMLCGVKSDFEKQQKQIESLCGYLEDVSKLRDSDMGEAADWLINNTDGIIEALKATKPEGVDDED